MNDIKFICVEEFVIPIVDGDGFSTDEPNFIEKGSIWFYPEETDYRFIGGEVRLENDDLDWIEITNKDFRKYFREESE